MPRPISIDPTTECRFRIPESTRGWLELTLYSEVEGKIPYGRMGEFFLDLLREYREWERLDLAPYGFPPGYIVSGHPEVIDALKRRLV